MELILTIHAANQVYAKRALRWVCGSKTPLTLAALCEIVAFEDGIEYAERPTPVFQNQLLALCSSFLHYSATDDKIGTAHYTVKEYFETPKLKYEAFLISDDDYLELGKSCLRYLLLPDYHIDSNTSPEQHDALLKARPFRKHAIQNWIHHTTDKETNFRHQELNRLAARLFKPTQNPCFLPFAVENYFFAQKSSHQSISLFEAHHQISPITPLHLSSALGLWQLVETLAAEDAHSVNLMTSYGAPLHCAVDQGRKSLAGVDEPLDGNLQVILEALIAHGANVNQSYRRDNQEFLQMSLTQVPFSSGVILLKAGLFCDKRTMNILFNKESKALERHGITKNIGEVSALPESLFDKLEECNILESEQDDWLKLRLSKERRRRGTFPATTEVNTGIDWEQQLLLAVKARETQHALSLLEDHKLKGTAVDTDGSSACHHSAKIDSVEILSRLKEVGAEMNTLDKNDQTPLHWAAQHGGVESCRYLAELSPEDNLLIDTMGRTPLHLAVAQGHSHIIAIMCTGVPGLLEMSDREGYSAFLATAQTSHAKCLENLLKYITEEEKSKVTPQGHSALHLACRSGSCSTVKILLSNGLDPNVKSKDGSTPLHFATGHPDEEFRLEMIRLFLEAHADPSAARSDGSLPIHLLLTNQRSTTDYEYDDNIFYRPRFPTYGIHVGAIGPGTPPEEFDTLSSLSRGFTDCQNSQGETTLHMACKNLSYKFPMNINSSDYLGVLLKQGYDVLKEDNQGRSPLQVMLDSYASAGSFSHIPLGVLLDNGNLRFAESLSVSLRQGAYKALSKALKNSSWPLCEQLIELVEDVSYVEPTSQTSPLLLASSMQCNPTVFLKMLLKSSDLSQYNGQGWAPLHLAVQSGRLALVRMLIGQGAGVNLRSQNAQAHTPLLRADIRSQTGQQIAQYLLESGADVNLRSARRRSPLHSACMEGFLGMLEAVSLEEIRAAGRLTFTAGSRGSRRWVEVGCFHCAALGGHIEIAQFLLSNNIAVVDETSDIEEMTALHIAADKGDIAFAKFLIKSGASPNQRSATGETPFSMALRQLKPEMMEFLLENGAVPFEDGRSSVWMEVVGWRNSQVRHILQRSCKSVSETQGPSLCDILEGYSGDAWSASARDTLTKGLKYAIQEGEHDLCVRILTKNPVLDLPMGDCGECGPLLYSLCLGHFDIAYELVNAGCSIQVIACGKHESRGFDPAHYATINNKPKLLELILSRNYHCISPVHPVMAAIACRHLPCLDLLLDHATFQHAKLLKSDNSSANIFEFRNLAETKSWPWELLRFPAGGEMTFFWTALHFAVNEKVEAIVHRLLKCDASIIDATDAQGRTALHIAASQGALNMIDILLRAGADETIRTLTEKETPLFKAIFAKSPAVAQRLLTATSMNIREYMNWSPLHSFTESLDEASVAQLIEMNVEINITNDAGTTPLHLAARNSKAISIMKLLLEAGADVHIRDQRGHTPLHVAISFGNSIELCKLLFEYGAKVDAVSSERTTALHHAVEVGSVPIAEWILHQDTSLTTAKSSFGCLPSHYALQSSEATMHQFALELSPDKAFHCSNHCGSYLHMACQNGRSTIFKQVVSELSQAEFQQICRKSNEAVAPLLTLAVQCGDLDILTCLLDAGADINISSSTWCSPLYAAFEYVRLDIVKLLLRRDKNAICRNYRDEDVSRTVAAKDSEKALLLLKESGNLE